MAEQPDAVLDCAHCIPVSSLSGDIVKRAALSVLLIALIASAIRPYDRPTWLLEASR